MSLPRKNADRLVNVGDSLPVRLRWFREIDRVHERYGLWHVGPVPKGQTWPAGDGLCGVPAPSRTLGSHETAIPALAHRSDLCPACVEIFRIRFGGFVG